LWGNKLKDSCESGVGGGGIRYPKKSHNVTMQQRASTPAAREYPNQPEYYPQGGRDTWERSGSEGENDFARLTLKNTVPAGLAVDKTQKIVGGEAIECHSTGGGRSPEGLNRFVTYSIKGREKADKYDPWHTLRSVV